MKIGPTPTPRPRGASLVETVIAMGVLSVAIPLVFGAIAESGKSGMASEAETRSSWIVPACMDEVQASRDGKPRFFTITKPGDALPAAGTIWALGFSGEGGTVGKMSKEVYDKGAQKIDGKPIRYIATISATPEVPATIPPVMRLKITVEYPSTSPVEKRQKLDFYSRIP